MFGTTARATLIVAAKDEASDTMARLAQQAKNGGDAVGKMGESAGKASAGFNLMGIAQAAAVGGAVALGAAAVSAGVQAWQLGMKAEQTAMAFETLLGSAEAATAHLKELRDFAASTPFQFSDLTESSKKLQALGFEAGQVVPMLRDIGDAVSAMGGNSQMIDRVVMAMGQMQAKGKATGEELMQMTEAGIPALRYMAKAAGVSTDEMQKLISKGLVPADEAIQAILAGMREDFGGMMAKQAETAAGKLSNLEDAWESLLTTIGKYSTESTGAVASAGAKMIGTLDQMITAVMEGDQRMTAAWRSQIIMTGLWKATLDGLKDVRNFAKFFDTLGDSIDYAGGKTDETKRKIQDQSEVLRDNKNFFLEQAAAAREAAEAQAELTSKLGDTEMMIAGLSTLMSGPMGKELENHAETTQELTTRQAELKAQIDKLTASNGAYWENVEHSGATQAELTLTTLRLAEAQGQLGEALSKTGDEYDPMKIAELNVRIEDLQKELTGATTVTSGFIDNSKKIGELTTEYDAVTGEIQAQEKAHTLATRQILFNILQQQLANAGLLEEAGPQLLEIAKRWGLIDQATYDAMSGMMGAVQDAANSGDWNTLVGNADKVRFAIEGIPAQRMAVVTIETRYTQTGQPSAGAGDVGIQGWTPPSGVTVPTTPTTTTENQYDDKLAFGGPASAGGTYLWQESAMSRPEVFVPGTSGAVLTRQQAESMFGAHGGGGADVAAAIRSLPRLMAREIQTAIQFAIVRGG